MSTLIHFFFGIVDGLLYALMFIVALDYITGVCVAISTHQLSSNVGAKGIAKKVSIFAIISLAHVIDQYLLKTGNSLRTVTTCFYLGNELISILENIDNLGLPIPNRLRQILHTLANHGKE